MLFLFSGAGLYRVRWAYPFHRRDFGVVAEMGALVGDVGTTITKYNGSEVAGLGVSAFYWEGLVRVLRQMWL